jgi:hypothetical protein
MQIRRRGGGPDGSFPCLRRKRQVGNMRLQDIKGITDSPEQKVKSARLCRFEMKKSSVLFLSFLICCFFMAG